MTTKVVNADALVIDRALLLEPNENLEIHARQVEIQAGAQIVYQRTVCDFSNSPSVTIIADEDVTIVGAIDVRGKNGVVVAADSGCGQASGSSGGNVSIYASSIAVNGSIRTGAGTAAKTGASDGVNGDIVLHAAKDLTIKGYVIANGGALDWDAPSIAVTEPPTNNGTLSDAVVLAMRPMIVRGTVSANDDAATAGASDTMYYTPSGGKPIRLPDLYAMVNQGTKPMNLAVELRAYPDYQGDILMMPPVQMLLVVARFQNDGWSIMSAGMRASFVAQPGVPYLFGIAGVDLNSSAPVPYAIVVTSPSLLTQ